MQVLECDRPTWARQRAHIVLLKSSPPQYNTYTFYLMYALRTCTYLSEELERILFLVYTVHRTAISLNDIEGCDF